MIPTSPPAWPGCMYVHGQSGMSNCLLGNGDKIHGVFTQEDMHARLRHYLPTVQ